MNWHCPLPTIQPPRPDQFMRCPTPLVVYPRLALQPIHDRVQLYADCQTQNLQRATKGVVLPTEEDIGTKARPKSPIHLRSQHTKRKPRVLFTKEQASSST